MYKYKAVKESIIVSKYKAVKEQLLICQYLNTLY